MQAFWEWERKEKSQTHCMMLVIHSTYYLYFPYSCIFTCYFGEECLILRTAVI